MGYVCPVCETPQADGEHLANHLAFTALLHGEDHATWLDERVSDWADRSPDDLAAIVTEYAEETTYDAVFEDTTGVEADHTHRGDDAPGERSTETIIDDGGHAAIDMDDEEVRRVIEEARELTRQAIERDNDEE